MKTREEKIEALLQDWFDSISEAGSELIETILREGFVGYNHMSDEDLDRDYQNNVAEADEDEE